MLIVIPLLSSGAFAIDQSSLISLSRTETMGQCQKIETYQGPTGYRMVGAPPVMGSFKMDTMNKAKAMGATHIRWAHDNNGLGTSVSGEAYVCNQQEMRKPHL